MYTIRKTFRFEMAHQLNTSYSLACQELHGHSYFLELFITSKNLNQDGMVIDFKYVKDILNDYINSWDHCLVMSNRWPKEYLDILQKYNKRLKIVNYNPTAENMAKDIYKTTNNLLTRALIDENSKLLKPGEGYTPDISISKVRLHETTTGYVDYYED